MLSGEVGAKLTVALHHRAAQIGAFTGEPGLHLDHTVLKVLLVGALHASAGLIYIGVESGVVGEGARDLVYALGGQCNLRVERLGEGVLEAGLPTEPGCPPCAVDVEERITPGWKAEALILAVASGQNPEIYEAEIRAKTTPTVIKRLIINGREGK